MLFCDSDGQVMGSRDYGSEKSNNSEQVGRTCIPLVRQILIVSRSISCSTVLIFTNP